LNSTATSTSTSTSSCAAPYTPGAFPNGGLNARNFRVQWDSKVRQQEYKAGRRGGPPHPTTGFLSPDVTPNHEGKRSG